MPITNWPTRAVMDELIRIYASDPEEYWGKNIAPIKEVSASKVEWGQIYVNQGLTQANDPNADLPTVDMPDYYEHSFSPAYFEEEILVRKTDLLDLKKLGGTKYEAIKINEIIAEATETLNIRLENRIEKMRWDPLFTNQINIDERTVKFTAEYGISDSQLNNVVTAVWIDTGNAKPLDDLRSMLLLFRGTGRKCEQMIMNMTTAINMCNTDQIKNISFGAGVNAQVTPFNLESVFSLLIGQDVKLKIYDNGYSSAKARKDDWTSFIPDHRVLCLGKAKQGEIIDIVSTPNIVNGVLRPGKFAFVVDETDKVLKPKVHVVAGIYGLSRIRRPDLIYVLKTDTTENGIGWL